MRPGLLRRLDDTGAPLLIARLVLGVMMIGMGWSKAWDPVAFLKLLREYDMIPAGWYVLQNLIAVTLPWIEIVCGIALVHGVLIRGSSLVLLLLLTGFTFIIVLRAVDIHTTQGLPYSQIHFDCGCGGGDVYVVRKIPENVGLWLLALIGLISRSEPRTLGQLLRGRRGPQPVASQ